MSVLIGVSGCSSDKTMLLTEQENCSHMWEEINWSISNFEVIETIYCPKCKLEKEVSLKEWKRIQVDMKYKNDTDN